MVPKCMRPLAMMVALWQMEPRLDSCGKEGGREGGGKGGGRERGREGGREGWREGERGMEEGERETDEGGKRERWKKIKCEGADGS